MSVQTGSAEPTVADRGRAALCRPGMQAAGRAVNLGLPVIVVGWLLLSDPGLVYGYLAETGGALLCLAAVAAAVAAVRLAHPRRRALFRAELRWCGRAAVRHHGSCIVPVQLVLLVGLGLVDGVESFAVGAAMVELWATLPALLALFLTAPRAVRGRAVGGVLAILVNLHPAVFCLFFPPAVLFVVLQVAWAFLWLPKVNGGGT